MRVFCGTPERAGLSQAWADGCCHSGCEITFTQFWCVVMWRLLRLEFCFSYFLFWGKLFTVFQIGSAPYDHKTNTCELGLKMDFSFKENIIKYSPTAVAKKRSWLWRHPLHLMLAESPLLRGVDGLDRQMWAPTNLPSSVRSHRAPREAARPERHQCLGVHNNATRALSQPFVSATLALRELHSISCRESGTPAPHPSQVLSPVDGPLPRLFPRPPVRLSATFFSWTLPPCTSHLAVPVAITLCTGIHHRGHCWTISFPFVPALQELTVMAGDQWYVAVNSPFLQHSSINHWRLTSGGTRVKRTKIWDQTPWTHLTLKET